MTRRAWTAAEIEKLRRDYPDTPTGDLARELGRGVVEVFEKAQELRIEKSAEYRAGPLAGLLHRPKRRVWTDAEVDVLREQLARAVYRLTVEGYREHCDIPACNCGNQWAHGGRASMRLMEISDALEGRDNGSTILEAVKQLVRDDDLRGEE